MTNIDMHGLVARLEWLGHAMNAHIRDAEPGEQLVSPDVFWDLAAFLNLYSDSKAAQLVGERLQGAPPEVTPPVSNGPMLWIAYDVMGPHIGGREQFNGDAPAWGESDIEFESKQGIEVPRVGDELSLKMGSRTVYERRLERPETDDEGRFLTPWYWTVLVK